VALTACFLFLFLKVLDKPCLRNLNQDYRCVMNSSSTSSIGRVGEKKDDITTLDTNCIVLPLHLFPTNELCFGHNPAATARDKCTLEDLREGWRQLCSLCWYKVIKFTRDYLGFRGLSCILKPIHSITCRHARTRYQQLQVGGAPVKFNSFKYTLPFKSLGSLRNVFIFQRKALFFQ